jgi:hypothetical protein
MFKVLITTLLMFTSLQALAVDLDAPDYNQQRAVALVDAKLLGERDVIGLSMDRYRIISDKSTSKSNDITVGVSGPGGECTVLVQFKSGGSIIISDQKCQPGT